MAETYRLGCDIGGTFTDFVLLDDETGEITTHKCLTTPRDPSDAVEEGVRALTEARPGGRAGPPGVPGAGGGRGGAPRGTASPALPRKGRTHPWR